MEPNYKKIYTNKKQIHINYTKILSHFRKKQFHLRFEPLTEGKTID